MSSFFDIFFYSMLLIFKGLKCVLLSVTMYGTLHLISNIYMTLWSVLVYYINIFCIYIHYKGHLPTNNYIHIFAYFSRYYRFARTVGGSVIAHNLYINECL